MDSYDLPRATKYCTIFVDKSDLFKFCDIFPPQKTVPNFSSKCEMFEYRVIYVFVMFYPVLFQLCLPWFFRRNRTSQVTYPSFVLFCLSWNFCEKSSVWSA